MAISASMVKDLRERTGAGMMECKKALVETSGDMDAAIELLRKSGQAKADKKAGRIAADGRVGIAIDGARAAIVEVNSETDFVANDENFVAFVDAVAKVALQSGATDVDTLSAAELEDGRSVEQARTDLVAKVGENIGVRRVTQIEAGDNLGSYVHGGSKIGALVAMKGGSEALARDVAMHVAAINPTCIDESGVPPDTLEKERRIIREEAEASGKPAEIVERMVDGRMAKFLKEITLLGQPFVKDDKTTVGKLLQGKGADVTAFVRFEVGEGIEKREDNFVQEVMNQVKGAG